MRRFLLLWLCMAITLGMTSLAVSLVVYRHLDLGYVTLVHLLVIPAFQAVVVSWVGNRWGLSDIAWAARETRQHSLIVIIVVLDALVLLVGLVSDDQSMLALAAPRSLQPYWAALKAFAAGALLILGCRGSEENAGRKAWILGLAACLLALGIEPIVPWLRRLPEIISGVHAETIRWLFSFGGFWALVMVFLVMAGSVVRRGSRLAAFYLDLSAACLFAIGLIVPLNIFLRPFLMEPWSSIVTVLASTGATAALGASILGMSRDARRPESRESSR
jgi:hypothetical protein